MLVAKFGDAFEGMVHAGQSNDGAIGIVGPEGPAGPYPGRVGVGDVDIVVVNDTLQTFVAIIVIPIAIASDVKRGRSAPSVES